MILRHMPFHDRDLMLPADVPDQIPNSSRHLAVQRRPSILRDPHQMQMNFKYGARPAGIPPFLKFIRRARAESRRLKARVLTLPVRDNKTRTSLWTMSTKRLEERSGRPAKHREPLGRIYHSRDALGTRGHRRHGAGSSLNHRTTRGSGGVGRYNRHCKSISSRSS